MDFFNDADIFNDKALPSKHPRLDGLGSLGSPGSLLFTKTEDTRLLLGMMRFWAP